MFMPSRPMMYMAVPRAHCIIDGELSLAAAHEIATDMERRLRTCAPKLDRILIHTDPSALIVMPEGN